VARWVKKKFGRTPEEKEEADRLFDEVCKWEEEDRKNRICCRMREDEL